MKNQNLEMLRGRSIPEWMELIEGLPKEWRGEVARIVWWDFFGDRLVSEPLPEFDKFLTPPFPMTTIATLEKGLARVGYAKKRIESRLFAYTAKGGKK